MSGQLSRDEGRKATDLVDTESERRLAKREVLIDEGSQTAPLSRVRKIRDAVRTSSETGTGKDRVKERGWGTNEGSDDPDSESRSGHVIVVDAGRR